MPAKKAPMPAPNTFPDLLLAVTAVSGELPTAQVSRLPGAMTYKQKAITQVKKDHLLHVYSRNNLRGYRLTGVSKRALIKQYPERYQPLLSGETTLNAPKYSDKHRARLHRMAEAFVSMLNAGVLVFPWEKPAVFQPDNSLSDISLPQPSYYSSLEVKEMGLQGRKIRGSRATGLLFADSAVFAVYNVGPADMRWDYHAETRLKAMMQTDLCEYRINGHYATHQLHAILFADDMNQLEKMLEDAKIEVESKIKSEKEAEVEKAEKAKTVHFLLYGSYEHFHFLTNDRRGEMILRFLTERETKVSLDGLLMNGLRRSNSGWGLEHDGFDKDGTPVLFGYSCDLSRIKRFAEALDKRGANGTLICFDFQMEALRKLCGDHVDFQCIDPDAVEEAVFDQQEKTH